MHIFAIMMLAAAIGRWIGSSRRRKRARRRTTEEITATLETGLPSPGTAVGRRALEVKEAQEIKLHSPPPVHGTARWATPEDAVALIDGNGLITVGGTRGLTIGKPVALASL
jgi:hypothetical protein